MKVHPARRKRYRNECTSDMMIILFFFYCYACIYRSIMSEIQALYHFQLIKGMIFGKEFKFIKFIQL